MTIHTRGSGDMTLYRCPGCRGWTEGLRRRWQHDNRIVCALCDHREDEAGARHARASREKIAHT